MYLVKTPSFVPFFFKRLIWGLSADSEAVYVTFDDGPHPQITPEVLNILDAYDAKATFFCVGENIRKYPEIFYEIIKRGHAVGNHTYNHLNGFNTKLETYIENVTKCQNEITTILFRPPYGKITRKQIQTLYPRFHIIMWTILSGDFDSKISAQTCFNNVNRHLEKGAIIVFHDSEKAKQNMLYALPKTLQAIKNKNLICRSIQLPHKQ